MVVMCGTCGRQGVRASWSTSPKTQQRCTLGRWTVQLSSRRVNAELGESACHGVRPGLGKRDAHRAQGCVAMITRENAELRELEKLAGQHVPQFQRERECKRRPKAPPPTAGWEIGLVVAGPRRACITHMTKPFPRSLPPTLLPPTM